MKTPAQLALYCAIAAAASFTVPVRAQEGVPGQAGQAEQIARQLNNPIADLVSVPFQFNWENGVGGNDDLRFVLNVQPLVPFSISPTWKLVGRFILPFISQPAGLVPGSQSVSGTGDIVASAFFQPSTKGVIFGFGPVFGLPTTSDPLLGSGKWQIGPTAVIVQQQGPWTYGALMNHLWSIANTGSERRPDTSQTLLQPFLAYTTRNAVTFTIQSETTYNWKAESGQRWTAPINLQVSKVTSFGPFPLSVGCGGGYYVQSPDAGPEWKLRLTFTLILPRAKQG